MRVQLVGIGAAQRALSEAIKDIDIETELMVKVMLDGIAANTKPYVPVDTAFLINSEFQKIRTQDHRVVGEIGYGADYAEFVHEGPQKNWQKPGASNLFLEKGVRDFVSDDLSSIIARFSSK